MNGTSIIIIIIIMNDCIGLVWIELNVKTANGILCVVINNVEIQTIKYSKTYLFNNW